MGSTDQADQVNENQDSRSASAENLAAETDGVEGQPLNHIWILREELKHRGEYLATPGTPARFYVEYVPAEQWQPIETAPKDGTFILLLGDSGYISTPHRIEVGRWITNYRDWWVTIDGSAFTDGGVEPTHWMPLPNIPAAAHSTT